MPPKRNDYLNEAYGRNEAVDRERRKQIEYDSRLKAYLDRKALFEEGYEKGLAKVRAEVMAALKAKGMSDEELAKWFGS